MNFVFLFFGFVLFGVLAALRLILWRFHHSPAYLWRERVFARHWEIVQKLQEVNSPGFDRSQLGAAGSELFTQQLQSIPCSAVTAFPGLGAGTVDRLVGAGCRNLADLLVINVRMISGFGPVKSRDVHNAVRTLVEEAKRKFDSGESIQGRRFQELLKQKGEEERRRSVRLASEREAVHRAARELEPFLDIAYDVTFLNHLIHKGIVPGLTEELLHQPLPTIEKKETADIPRAERVEPTPPKEDLFQDALAKSQTPTAPETPAPDHNRLRVWASLLVFIAKSDGKIAQVERKVIRTLLVDQFGQDRSAAAAIDPLLEELIKNPPTEHDISRAARLIQSSDELTKIANLLSQVAEASGGINSRESQGLKTIYELMGFQLPVPSEPLPESPPAETKPVPPPEPFDARKVLELEPDISLSVELIRRRYNLFAEKVEKAKELGKEFVVTAEKRLAELRRAAEELLAPFGEPLEKPEAPTDTPIRHNPDLDDVFGG